MSSIHSNNYKKSREDYKFVVRASTSDTGTDMSLLKKVSIQFPTYATKDI